MKPKKSSKVDHSEKTGLFFSIGLVLAMSFVIMGFEWRTSYDVEIYTPDFSKEVDSWLEIPIIRIPTPPPPPKHVVIHVDPVELDEPDPEPFPVLDMSSIDLHAVVEAIKPPIEESTEPVEFPEVAAIPVGGFSVFYQHVKNSIHYPSNARRMGVKGKVFVQFVVEKDGQLTDIKVIKGIGSGCDEEAIRVIQAAPAWESARMRGKRVRQRIVIPIHFKLK